MYKQSWKGTARCSSNSSLSHFSSLLGAMLAIHPIVTAIAVVIGVRIQLILVYEYFNPDWRDDTTVRFKGINSINP